MHSNLVNESNESYRNDLNAYHFFLYVCLVLSILNNTKIVFRPLFDKGEINFKNFQLLNANIIFE